MAERLAGEGVRLHEVDVEPSSLADANALSRLAKELNTPGAVIDGYAFDIAFVDHFRQSGLRLMRVDDDPAGLPLGADQLVNPNLYMAEQEPIHGEPEIFAGPRYALLREEFRNPPPRTAHEGALRFLITLGGSDPTGATDLVLRALERVSTPLDVRVILGPARVSNLPHIGARHSIALLTDVRDMASQMVWADLALSGAGVACTELARCGVPVLALVQADNQVPAAAAVAELGLGWNLGRHPDEATLAECIETLARDATVRSAMATTGPRLVDGRGADRVAQAWELGGLRLRPVTEADSGRLYAWANDPGTRAMSFSGEPISWEIHLAWLARRLAEPATRFYIAEDLLGASLGQVRFQATDEGQAISVSLAPECRGEGWGQRIIAKACGTLPLGTTVAAYIKPENAASLRAFAKAGFGLPCETVLDGHRALRMDRTEGDA
jgi:spore coat polysaccharide biosynthesis predicted glycosyltransferase SpsG/L-amino acid N-acyltransferase YncA